MSKVDFGFNIAYRPRIENLGGAAPFEASPLASCSTEAWERAAGGAALQLSQARARGAIDFPLAGVAGAFEFHGGHARSLRVALTGTEPTRARSLLEGTGKLEGKAIDAAALAKRTSWCKNR
jgi:hypothetical protein